MSPPLFFALIQLINFPPSLLMRFAIFRPDGVLFFLCLGRPSIASLAMTGSQVFRVEWIIKVPHLPPPPRRPSQFFGVAGHSIVVVWVLLTLALFFF